MNLCHTPNASYSDGLLSDICQKYAEAHFPKSIAYESFRKLMANEQVQSLINSSRENMGTELTKIFKQNGGDFDFCVEYFPSYCGVWNTNIDTALPGIGHIRRRFGERSFCDKVIQDITKDTIKDIAKNPAEYGKGEHPFEDIVSYESKLKVGKLGNIDWGKHSAVVDEILAKRDEITKGAKEELEELLPAIASNMEKYRA